MKALMRWKKSFIFLNFFQFLILLFFPFKQDILNKKFSEFLKEDTYPYTNKWYYNLLDDLNPRDSRCPLCNFTIRNRKSNSRRDDFLMTTLLSNYVGIQPLIRTARTTRTNARFIIFIDQTVQNSLNEIEKNLLNYCGINLINVGKIPKYYRYAYCFLRFYIYYDFFAFYHENINRIIFFDGMDSIFQGDPFYEDFTPDKLIFTLENRIVGKSKWAVYAYKNYFKKINQENNSLYLNFSVINCGLIIGGKRPIFAFLNIFKARFNRAELMYQLKNMNYVDQAVLHSMVLDGEFEKLGIKVYLYTIDDDYVSISFGCWGWKCKKRRRNNYSIGNFYSRKTYDYPLIVHQFNRYFQFSVSVFNACPPIDKNISLDFYIKDYPKE
ncbi:hypothetical protein M9Y10_023131 [Tritrichomonas musculus]|uniref:Uncharacterized protein n=1 Tax=Tritrichomonas musculus TaxID=1915356 RepID=A0ABR2KU83_9EUKA